MTQRWIEHEVLQLLCAYPTKTFEFHELYDYVNACSMAFGHVTEKQLNKACRFLMRTRKFIRAHTVEITPRGMAFCAKHNMTP